MKPSPFSLLSGVGCLVFCATLIASACVANAVAEPSACFQPTPTPQDKISVCNELIEGGEASPDELSRAYFERGKAHRYFVPSGDKIHYLKALRDFGDALQLGADRSEILSERAPMHALAGELEFAISDITELISLRPDDPAAYVSRGLYILAEAGGLDELLDVDGQIADRALFDFETALRLAPKNKRGLTGKASALIALNNYEEAIATYSELIAIDPSDVSSIEARASVKTIAGDMTGAIRDFSTAILMEPNDAELYFTRANLYLMVDQVVEAVRDYRRARSLKPGDPEILRWLKVAEARMTSRDL
ncbi:tetratricopeptide repeat protein [Bauldia litoralis]|uniref:tetratricopeptide repeat protein n=1 Tax=Bauldia litoralis TaxID=665467 RepID=UPI003263C9E8